MYSSHSAFSIASNFQNTIDCFQKISEECTVPECEASVQLLNVFKKANGIHEHCWTLETCCNSAEMSAALATATSAEFSAHVYFIAQRNSHSAPSISNEILDLIMQEHDISPQLFDMFRSFKERSLSTGNAHCRPLQIHRDGAISEMSYVYKYAELKTNKCTCPWVIRQTGVYHQYDSQNSRSVYIVLSPMRDSLGEKRLLELLKSRVYAQELIQSPSWLHLSLIGTYLPFWEGYCAHYEERLQKILVDVSTCDLTGELSFSHSTLLLVHTFERCFMPLKAIFKSGDLLMKHFRSNSHRGIFPAVDKNEHLDMCLENMTRQISAAAAHGENLLDSCRIVRGLLSETLNFKEQLHARQQAELARQQNNSVLSLTKITAYDSTAIKVITLLTLVYLPSSFIAAVMGMEFFAFDVESGTISVSPRFWVYFVVSLPLTVGTFAWWKWRSRKTPPEARSEGTLVDIEKQLP